MTASGAGTLPHGARVLLVRMGALGDIVHALPVLAAIRSHRPDVEVDWLVDARYAAVLALVDGLNRRVVVRAHHAGESDGEIRFAGLPGMASAVGYLRRRRYAAAIDLQGLLKSALFARASGAQRVIGFVRAQLREPLALRFYGETVAGPEAGHVVHKNLSVLEAIGLPSTEIAFPWRSQPSAVADQVSADLASAATPGFALINPGAAWENKRWPPERFGELAALLGERLRLTSVVTWGPAERGLADQVVAHARGRATASPPTALHDLLALARRARLIVSGDTGPLHLAASVGTPVVALFGPTRPERNGPWRAEDQSVSRATTCVCFHKRQCLRGRPCVEDIGVDEVFDACARRLREDRAS